MGVRIQVSGPAGEVLAAVGLITEVLSRVSVASIPDPYEAGERISSMTAEVPGVAPGRPRHGAGSLPHGYIHDGCGDRCDNRQCPAGLSHDRCDEGCVKGGEPR